MMCKKHIGYLYSVCNIYTNAQPVTGIRSSQSSWANKGNGKKRSLTSDTCRDINEQRLFSNIF